MALSHAMRTTQTVLVVDDTYDSRLLAAFILEDGGFGVVEAATGEQALAAARTAGPDAIVLDVHLPDLDGFEVCRRLKADPGTARIPVLFLSATYTGLEARTRGFQSGAEGYLTKPFEPAELVSSVRNLVRLREAEVALRTRDSLLAIARAVGSVMNTTKALRLVCRELARLTGAEAAGAHLLDRERDELRPVAGYRIPKNALAMLAAHPLPRQPFWPELVRGGEIVWSDDVAGDARFAASLFREIPHQSGAMIPLVVDGEIAGTFYLAWWTARRRIDQPEAAMLQAIGQQVGLLLRNTRLVEEAELRRRVAEAAREHYQLLFERNLAGVFRCTFDGRMLECNEAFTRLLGHRTREEALRHNAWERCADTGERDRLLARLRGEGRVANHEARWRRASGADLTLMMNATRIGEGPNALVEGIVLDVTERKRAEDALRARESQLRNLGDNLPQGVIYQVVRRPDGSNYFPYMSAGLEEMFGATVEEAMRDASVVYRLVVPEDLPLIRAAADESIRTGEPMDVEYRLRAADGALRWFNLRGRPSPLPDGSTLWDVMALDITARKHAEDTLREREAQLRRSEARYRLLFERSFVGIFRTRADGIVMDCNDAFARILGYTGADEMRGRNVADHYVEPTERDEIVARLAAGEDVVDVEVLVRRVDGVSVAVLVCARRLVEPDGPIHEGIALDLSDRKRAEQASALQSVAELANAAAHEINNPLTIVLGQLSLIGQGRNTAAAGERARTAALRIRDIVLHMTRITRLERAQGWSPTLPIMLDLRRSGGEEDTSSGPRG